MGLLDGLAATNRKEPDRLEASTSARCRWPGWPRSRPPAASAARASSTPAASSPAGGIASGMELGFHLLRRAGYAERFIDEVARVMEYTAGYAGLQERPRARARACSPRAGERLSRLIVVGAGGDPLADRFDLVGRQRLVGRHAHPHGGHRSLELLQQVRRIGIAGATRISVGTSL